ncbi:MAG: geranylgeranylglyceryl/heptaprenylglyceryl phosphate synthase [Bacteroidota bacterium]|nr:geranylgeranylglyceryl/heptaprenylglyceryl phosphate synthase [Bacteroidota bacterium]MDX5430277.1 geranylgeranylglyceryl/heptaprenylglyceryl phosphate synthase [Bacteroidota bacterium]MDX5469038.1 geranylgeranylglyceryl/heptaprenylglyceryl phosphate synthase [Bacteroidota bacterium]
MRVSVYDSLVHKQSAGQKMLAVLIDPDHIDRLEESVRRCNESGVDLIFLGGSLVSSGTIAESIEKIKQLSDIPVLLFPGDELQIDGRADALLLLSLISGRNPELLIGKHVVAAPYIKKSGIEAISTGYMLIDGGRVTTASYISGTVPIPADKPEIAMCTAMAGEMLGLKLIYMDAGSGANQPVNTRIISAVRSSIEVPIVVGGGIRSTAQAVEAWRAGADIVVVGNAIEDDNTLITDLMNALQDLQQL